MSLGFTDEQLEALFNAFDTDGNGLVDALELIISLVLASGKLAHSSRIRSILLRRRISY